MLILRVYAKQLKRITFSHKITSLVNQGAQLENQGAQLCQTDPNAALASTPDFFILDNAGLHKLMRIQK
jgi:hypothetical protein